MSERASERASERVSGNKRVMAAVTLAMVVVAAPAMMGPLHHHSGVTPAPLHHHSTTTPPPRHHHSTTTPPLHLQSATTPPSVHHHSTTPPQLHHHSTTTTQTMKTGKVLLPIVMIIINVCNSCSHYHFNIITSFKNIFRFVVIPIKDVPSLCLLFAISM